MLNTTGGCWADIHSPIPMFSAQARHVTGKRSAGACMGSAAGREGWHNSPQPRAGYSAARGTPGQGMPCMEDVGLTYTPLYPCSVPRLAMSWTEYPQGPVDVTWAVLLAARDVAIPLSHELGTQLASPTIISTVGEWPLYGYQSISPSCIASGRR